MRAMYAASTTVQAGGSGDTRWLMYLILGLGSATLGLLFTYFPWVVGPILAIVALCLVTFARPAYGAYFLMVFIPLRTFYISVYNPYRALLEYIPISLFPVFLIFFVTLAARISSGRPRRSIAGEGVLAFFVAFGLISLLWTYDIYHGSFMAVSLIAAMMTLEIYQQSIQTLRELKAAIWVFLVVLVGWGVTMPISYFSGQKTWVLHLFDNFDLKFIILAFGKRAAGFDGPHASSNNMVMGLYLLLALTYLYRARWRPIWFAIALFFLFNVFFSGNKGAAVSLVGSICYVVLVYKPLRRNAVQWLTASALTILGVFVIASVLFKADRLTASSDITALSFTTRLKYWTKGILSMEPNSWFGWGIGGFDRVIAPVPHAHSFYFNILFDLGVIGFVLIFAFMIWRALRIGMDIYQSSDFQMKLIMTCLSASLASQMIFNLVEFSYMYLHIWMYLGLLGAAQAISKYPEFATPKPSDV